jgi:CHAT domain-containing protein
MLYAEMGEYAKAVPLAAQAPQIMRGQLELSANVQSERQQLRMAEVGAGYLGGYLTVTGEAKAAAEPVYAEVLAWKGAVSARQQAMRGMRQSLQIKHSPELEQLFDDLVASSQELANQSLVSPKSAAVQTHQRKLAELSDRVERLQQELAAKSEEFRKQREQRRRTPGDIRGALPQDAALVDLVEYTHFARPEAIGTRPLSERRLVAFVVRPDQPVERIELGPVSTIIACIDAWRTNFGAGRADGAADPGQELRRLVWEKLEPHLAGAKTVLLSPDGVTARFPWPALPGKERGHYLIEETSIAIVPIPRLLPELLATGERTATEPPSLLLVGGVDFGADPGRIVDVALDRRAARGDQPLQWPPLPGTVAEVAAVKKAFEHRYPQLAPLELTGAAATKGSVRGEMSKCRYLHFSTHGFFAAALVKSAAAIDPRANAVGMSDLFTRQNVTGYHPDLLSGLVLAGANRPVENGQEDGILTALEVSGLDLSRVELATLSACETGLGETAGGEGLLGLQRAFQLAGARTTVASLWQVPDKATQLLMERFYNNLWNSDRKVSKLDALLDAQRWMLREGATQAVVARGLVFDATDSSAVPKSGRLPLFYWAAFVLSGDWR